MQGREDTYIENRGSRREVGIDDLPEILLRLLGAIAIGGDIKEVDRHNINNSSNETTAEGYEPFASLPLTLEPNHKALSPCEL